MLAEQFERISRVSCVVPLAQQQAKPLHSLHGAAPTAKEAPCPQHGVITSEISNPFLFVIVNLKIFCLFSLGNSPSRSPGLGVSLFTVQEHSPGDPQQAGCREGTAFADPLCPPTVVSAPSFPRWDAQQWMWLPPTALQAAGGACRAWGLAGASHYEEGC